jgi:hypothetical protein
LLINANSFVIEITSAKTNVQRTRIKEPRSNQVWKPTREQIAAAADKSVRDVIAPNLRVLFCGINPGLYTAAVGHHFARPGNRFWKALYEGGFTDRLLSPFAERELLLSGHGVTNVVSRATAAAEELTKDELTREANNSRSNFVATVLGFLPYLGSAPIAAPSLIQTPPLAGSRSRSVRPSFGCSPTLVA